MSLTTREVNLDFSNPSKGNKKTWFKWETVQPPTPPPGPGAYIINQRLNNPTPNKTSPTPKPTPNKTPTKDGEFFDLGRPSKGGSVHKEYHVYKGKKYLVRKGKRGGKYILVNHEKIYLPKTRTRGTRGGTATNIAAYKNLTYLYAKGGIIYNMDSNGQRVDALPTKIDTSLPELPVYMTIVENSRDDKPLEGDDTFIPVLFSSSFSLKDKKDIQKRPVSAFFKKMFTTKGGTPGYEKVTLDLSVDPEILKAIEMQKLEELGTLIPFLEDVPTFYAEWVLPKEAIVLVIGDVHGDINALKMVFQMWKENNWINNEGILREDIRIISLGDLIDYGSNSLKVLYAMVKLRALNPGKVMLLAGNHEGTLPGSDPDSKITDMTGRLELDTEFTKNGYLPIYEPLHRMNLFIKKTLTIGPAMLSLRFEGDKYRICMMHGMYPGYREQFNSTIYWWPKERNENMTNKYKGRDNMYIPSPYCQETEEKEPYVDTYYKSLIELTQWNDLAPEKATRSGNARGDMITEQNRLRMVEWAMDDLNTVMQEQGIKAFIRGHQDGCPGGAWRNEGVDELHPCSKNAIALNVNIAYEKEKWALKKSCLENITENRGWCENILPEIRGLPTETSPMKNHVYTISMAAEKTSPKEYIGSLAPLGGFMIINAQKPINILKTKGGRKKTTKGVGGAGHAQSLGAPMARPPLSGDQFVTPKPKKSSTCRV
jgi:hypothetical protein